MPKTPSLASLPVKCEGVRSFTDRFDAFLIDAWGVLHNGFEPLPGVLDCLAHFKDKGKKVIVLSNAARRADVLEQQMSDMGFPRDLYEGIVTSGEATWQALYQRSDDAHVNLGTRGYRISADYHGTTTIGLDIEWTDAIEDASFVLFLGLRNRGETVETYVPLLETMLKRNLTLLCANPDHVAIFGTEPVVCPGAVADRYKQMGGPVLYHGKPHESVYQSAFAMLGNPDKSRVAGIGDALMTDVAGARAFGLASVFITSGIHGHELGPWPVADEKLAALYEREAATPDWVIPALNW